jgi:hypothetical protein
MFFAILVFIFVIIQGFLTWRDKFFSPDQMRSKGISEGLPFIAHLGMSSSIILLAPVAIQIMCSYSQYWSTSSIIYSLMAAAVISAAMCYSYTFAKLPESHVKNGRPTPAGYVLFLQMVMVITITILFFFYTVQVATTDAIIVLVSLMIHIFVSTHIPLGLAKVEWFPVEPWRDWKTWATILVSFLILFWRFCVIVT